MLKQWVNQLRIAFMMLVLMTLVTGFMYPLLVTGLAQVLFPWKANGSIIERNGKSVGSALIGQNFSSPRYFWGRPSATSPYPYNGAFSSGSNSGPSNPDFLATVQQRVNTIKASCAGNNALVPVDLVTASASGLDPEISPLAALYQIPRIAKARNIPEEVLHILVERNTQERFGMILGEPRVNVLQLNLALDTL